MKKDNIRKKEISEDTKKRKRIFIYIVITIIAIALVYFLTMYLLIETKVINQGSFRINDFVVTSEVEVEESQLDIYGEEEKKEIENELESSNDFALNVSQKNIFNILIPKNDNITIERVYLESAKVTGMEKEIYLESGKAEKSISSMDKEIDILCEEEENQYLIKFSLVNKNILENVKIPEDVKKLVYDATILNTLKYDLSKLKYHFSASLNVVDNLGKTSCCKIDMDLPKEGLGENGIVIERENLEEYSLKLKNKYLNF